MVCGKNAIKSDTHVKKYEKNGNLVKKVIGVYIFFRKRTSMFMRGSDDITALSDGYICSSVFWFSVSSDLNFLQIIVL